MANIYGNLYAKSADGLNARTLIVQRNDSGPYNWDNDKFSLYGELAARAAIINNSPLHHL